MANKLWVNSGKAVSNSPVRRPRPNNSGCRFPSPLRKATGSTASIKPSGGGRIRPCGVC